MLQRVVVGVLLPLILAGCMPQRERAVVTQSSSSSSASPVPLRSSSSMDAAALAYRDFTEDVIGNGERSVLFFYAAWCPYCRTHDAKLTEWYRDQEFPVATYKVDYDDSLALRARYGVVSQHTFVLIDGQGEAIDLITNYPSDDDVLSLLRTQ